MNHIPGNILSECSCHGNPSPFDFPVQGSNQHYPSFEQYIPCPYSNLVNEFSTNASERKHTYIKAGEIHA